MTDINRLQEEELSKLNEEKQIFDLETLIIDGEIARIHVEIEFPIYKNGKVN